MRDQQICMRLLGEGKIQPVLDKGFRLSNAAEAHRYLENQQQFGKVLLAS
ncbi:zinc-binding dehydrogenase [Rhizobium leguminosarum]